ncbi:MAG: LPS assembly protein LptD [Methylococcales bacterium]
MPRRIILISCLALQIDSAAAESTGWNCDKSKNNRLWSCTAPAVQQGAVAESKSEKSIEKILSKTLSGPKASAVTLPPLKQEKKPVTEPAATPAPVVTEEAPAEIVPTQTETEEPVVTEDEPDTEKQAEATPEADMTEAEDNTGFQLFDPAFDRGQEQIFSRLKTRLKADPWAACATNLKTPNPYDTIVSNPALRDTAAMHVESDYSEIFDKVVTSFSGNVEIERADQSMLADKASYNSLSETMDAQGHVYYREDEISMFSDSVLLNLKNDEAHLRDALFISPRSAVRGSAKVVYQENKDFSHYKDVSYTSCPPGNQDWVIHAERFKMNKATGKAAAKNAWLEFKSVPVLYTPFISFPLDNRRMTGFLSPRPHFSGQNGIDISLPFYWNIAPNYDMTFRPRYLAKRGLMLGADMRYMNQMSNNELSFDVLTYDTKRNDQTRYQASFRNQTLLSPHMNTNINLNYVSDKKYISELGNALSFTDIRHVRSFADLNYNREGVNFLTRIDNYQTIDQSIPNYQKPYRKLPQVQLNLNHSFEKAPVDVGLENDFTVFQHNTNVDGERLVVKPWVSAPIKKESGFIIPKASLLHTDYFLNKQLDNKQSNINRNLPILSLDSGLFAEGGLDLFGTKLTHTLEPRLFYLYIPKSSQDDQPIFDTAPYDTNFDSLFRENRFSGVDRVQNANQLTVALTSRFLDADSGRERFKLSVGDIVYFQDRQAQAFQLSKDSGLTTLAAETNRFSNIVTEVSGQLTDNFSVSSGFQWDPYASRAVRKQIDLHYRNKWGHIVNLGYHQRKGVLAQSSSDDIIRQSDVSFRLPLLDNWFAIGRWQYSFLYNKTAESFLGLEKENCCWRFRIIGRHYINGLSLATTGQPFGTSSTSAIGDTQTTVMFQIELKSLSAFGNDVDAFLRQSIFGYSDL